MDVLFLCINLERSPDRRGRMEEAARKAGFDLTFVPAVDGRELDYGIVPSYDRTNRLRHAPDLKKGEIACVLSHKRALEAFLSSDTKFAVVFEDDAVLAGGFLAFVRKAIALPIPWDAINLENRNQKQLWPAVAPGIHASGTLSSGSAAWLYSRNGGELTLQSLQTFRHAIDTHLGFFWRHRMTALCAYPPLVTQDHSLSSTQGMAGRSVVENELSYSQFVRWRLERIEHSIRKRLAAYSILVRMKIAAA